MTDGYLTINSGVAHGDDESYLDLSQSMTGWSLDGSGANASRTVLGSTTPRVQAASVGYTISIPALEWSDDVSAVLLAAAGTLLVVREDDARALLTEGAFDGAPVSAPEDGEVVSDVVFRPTAIPLRGQVQPITANDQTLTVDADDVVWIAAAAGTGQVARGTGNVDIARASIQQVPGTGTSVTVPATITSGWLFYGVPVTDT